MGTLSADLTASDRHSLSELVDLARRSIEEVGTQAAVRTPAKSADLGHYWIFSFPESPTRRVRPVNSLLWVSDPDKLDRMVAVLVKILADLKAGRGKNTAKADYAKFIGENGIPRTLYTVQQAISLALDCFLPDNQARKRAGQYFEDLFSTLLDAMGIRQQRVSFRLPVPGIEGSTFSIEIDRVINTRGLVKSTPARIDPSDLLVSLKTSSKDRYPKLLVDSTIAEKISQNPMKLVAIFHNDVQRAGDDGVTVTFLAQQYLVYTQYLSKPSGVYYVDPPGHWARAPWNTSIKQIDSLLLGDIWKF